MKSLGSLPKFSPLIVTLVPGGPSFGDTPVTKGAAISLLDACFTAVNQLKDFLFKAQDKELRYPW